MTKISNATPGPRGLHTKNGLVWVEGYQSVDAEFEDDKQLQAAMDTGWFIKGERKAPGGDDGSDVESLKAEVDRLTRANAVLETDNGQLKAELASAQGKGGGATGAYTVTDKGRGWFAITQDGKEVTKSLREDDVKDFDKLDADKQKSFVEANKAD